MGKDFVPDPDPSGRLDPPRRNPPTAVGVLTPPPPPRRTPSGVYRSSLRARLAQGFVGVVAVGVGSGIVAAASGVIGVAAGVAVALTGAPLLFASARSDGARVLRFSARRPRRLRRAA